MRSKLFITIGVLIACVVFTAAITEAAPTRSKKSKSGALKGPVQEYSSRHFLIYTDLSAEQSKELLRKLEDMLKLIAVYWGRQPRGIIECCVVEDLSKWPQDLIAKMEPQGLAKIREGAGVCLSTKKSRGNKFVSKSRVYSVAKGGVPLHEAVHAYCHQTFGTAGPLWYAECMAEMGHYWEKGVKGVNVPKHVIRFLRQDKPRPLESLIDNREITGGTWEDYCWWWMLGHLLDNSPNYYAQYRSFGRMVLGGKQITFQDVFGPTAKELEFELLLLKKHLQNGYRVDLCYWDWKKKFTDRFPSGRAMTVTVLAGRGWQPSGLTVTADTAYAFETDGTWRIAGEKSDPVSPDGDSGGKGKLVGVLMKDYQLSEEFELGKSGSFTPPSDGDLYLRCRVPWNKIGDNSGKITVRLKKE